MGWQVMGDVRMSQIRSPWLYTLNISLTLSIFLGNYGKVVDIFQFPSIWDIPNVDLVSTPQQVLKLNQGSIKLLGPGCLLIAVSEKVMSCY